MLSTITTLNPDSTANALKQRLHACIGSERERERETTRWCLIIISLWEYNSYWSAHVNRVPKKTHFYGLHQEQGKRFHSFDNAMSIASTKKSAATKARHSYCTSDCKGKQLRYPKNASTKIYTWIFFGEAERRCYSKNIAVEATLSN